MFTHEAIMDSAIKEFAEAAKGKLAEAYLETMKLENKIDAMLREYDKALADPQTKIPTALHLMIEALRP